MTHAWFRVPEWVWAVNDEASGKKARAWVYLLGSWHAGNDPGIREVMRATGYGGGMTTALVRDVARWAHDVGARLPEQWMRSAGTVQSSNAQPPKPTSEGGVPSAGTVDAFCWNDSRARAPYETRRDETRRDPHTEPAPAPAAALPPTPEPTHDDRPAADSTPGPDAHRPTDGGGGHAEQGGEAPALARPTEDDAGPPAGKGSPGPAVAAWEVLDAIRRRNVKGAGRLTMTAAMGKAMKERLREHTADDLALMVEWVTGCRCGGHKCRACSWLQPKGYTHPKTYLRPDNCSEYLDLARQAEAATIVATPAPADLMDNYRRLVGILCQRDDRRLIEGDNERHTLTLRYAVKLCGGRDAFRSDPDAFASRWPEVWAAAESEVTAKLAAMGQP